MYQETSLPNGLRIIGEVMPHVHSVAVGFWVGAGSRDEQPGREGISHLIEHMLFKGTAKRTAKEISECIDAVGGQLNAFTTREYTCYYTKILDYHLELGLSLLAEMVCQSVLAETELRKEKGVILEEIRSYEDAPDELIHDLLAAALWPDHPLGRPILGSPASVAAISRDDVLDFMSAYYRPEQAVLAVAGNVDFARFSELAGKYLAGLTPGPPPPARVAPTAACESVLRPKDTEQVHLCLGGQSVDRYSDDRFTIHVLDSILGGSVSSRLFQILREDRGLVYATGTSHSFFRDAGLLSIYAGMSPENTAEVLQLITGELRDLVRNGVTEEELTRAREQLRGTFLMSLESTSTRMSRLAKAALFDEPMLAPEEIIVKLEQVTSEDVKRTANRIFASKPLPLAVIAPTRARMDLDKLVGGGVII